MTNDSNVSALLDEMNRMRAGGGLGAGYLAEGEALPLRRVLGMRVGPELYGISIENITEIHKLTPVTFVPGAPGHILGVTSLRGQIAPVVNLRQILGVEGDADRGGKKEGPGSTGVSIQAKPRIVVVHHNELSAGLLVDSVTEVYDLRVAIEPPIAAPTRGVQIKEGQVMLGERMLILLHVPSLFTQLMEP